jgi:hypothetical protein
MKSLLVVKFLVRFCQSEIGKTLMVVPTNMALLASQFLQESAHETNLL